jgi:hypothetical protein
MSATNEFADSLARRLTPPTLPLDEGVWSAWVSKGRAQERRSNATRVKAVIWISIAALSVLVVAWSLVVPYHSIFRFVVAAGAFALMFHEYHARQFAFAAVFGALVLLYNPVVPVFPFSGDWQRAVVLATLAPFVASLATRNARTSQDA